MLNGFYAEKKVFFLSSSSGLELTGLLGGSGLGLIGLYWGSTIFPIHTSPSLYSRVPPPPLGTNCLCMSVKLVVYLLMLSLLVIFLDRKFNQGEKFNGEFGSKEEK